LTAGTGLGEDPLEVEAAGLKGDPQAICDLPDFEAIE
jgi:hypothetical protein